ncbi:MAG: hypothetical protein JNJ77_11295 [Planctomycetia bacterium]|nr:hypothetical protein [Planctomycetia bacterium]
MGEYIEVVDVDPASGVAYKPVDLNDERLLAQNGLAPSEANPQFHQQMVYAVAMATIGQFEQALGRVALWSSHRENEENEYIEKFVPRLRIYPHALRDRNAYYSPAKKALLFGYFPVGIKDANNTPGTLVFTCLSHDIIAHETTHALLDGVHPRFNEPVNGDVFAFHEAFADIVALFQHFSYPGVLRDQIARTRGDLGGENILGQLAQQFGKASGRGRALRDFLGKQNADGKWEPLKPDVRELERTTEPHARGAILVAAVFNAFLKVYRARTVDLYRIASEGTGVLREGEIHPDLAYRLADEAARAALQTLQMCIRAIDYCPPVGITFGDYLRAIVTADTDFNPDDPSGFRLAFIESFRQWGIHPGNMRSMSAESLLWPTGVAVQEEQEVHLDREDLKDYFTQVQQPTESGQSKTRHRNQANLNQFRSWTLESDRFQTWQGMDSNAAALWSWLVKGKGRKWAKVIGIVLEDDNPPQTVFRKENPNRISVEVHSVRSAVRRSQRGAPITDLVVEITQRRRGFFDLKKQKDNDDGKVTDEQDFIYRAGCTLLINPNTMEIRRVIRTPGTIKDDVQLDRMRKYLLEGANMAVNAFQTKANHLRLNEPFALLHSEVEN